MNTYQEVLKRKVVRFEEYGFTVEPYELNPILFPFQRDIVLWALRLGSAAVFADCGLGKGQPLDSFVLSPTGWVKMRKLQVGDLVVGSDGKAYPVTGIYPRGEQETYRFNFTDGTSLVVDDDHLWNVKSYNDKARGGGWRTLSTRELRNSNLTYGNNRQSRTWHIPLVEPVEFVPDDSDLLINPYVMGVLLGDGGFSVSNHVGLSNPEQEIIDSVKSLLPTGCTLRRKGDSIDWTVVCDGVTRNPLIAQLKRYGLMGLKSPAKFVPRDYLFNTATNRIALLQGLMDTDGHAGDTPEFCSASIDLANAVVFLVQSLGGTARVNTKPFPTYTHNGEKRVGLPSYRVTMTLPEGIEPFRLTRKAKAYKTASRGLGRWIESIEYAGIQKTQCISVASPDNLYVTEHFIVTHNTAILSEWAKKVASHTQKPVLISSPLGVTGQTIQMACDLMGIPIVYARSQADLSGDEEIVITNYEMVDKFRPEYFSGLVLDESSILKNYTGKTKQLLLKIAQKIPYRLALTATPAPNDHLELGNHAEFLGIMRSREMIQRWFVNDAMNAGGYSLREHGRNDFWRWVASWAVSLQKPSDIGNYSDDGYILPDLNFAGHMVNVDHKRAWNETNSDGQLSLLLVGNTSATAMHKEKRATLEDRMKLAADVAKIELSKHHDEFAIVWCEYDYEADILRRLLPDAVEVRGSEPLEVKQNKLLGFGNGEYRTLITKPKIAAHGLNWQHAGIQVWTSITHKFEPFYQGYKRSHRFGRKKAVNCHIVYAESEGSILANLNRKHQEHVLMQREMVRAMRENGMSVKAEKPLLLVGEYGEYESGDNWKIYHGDSAITLKNEPSESVDFIVQSPPFKSLYIYSSNLEDLGNNATDKQFYDQYRFILEEEYRLAKDGTYKCEHCKDLPLYQNRDDAMGLQDFPGELIAAHLSVGWQLVDWVTIWKDPAIEMLRTKNAGLIWSSAFCERGERCRQGMADYVLVFQKIATPLPVPDYKPLPPAVIARCIELWSNPGENVQLPGETLDGIIDLAICDDTPDFAYYAKNLRSGRNLIVNVSNPLDMAKLITEAMPFRLVFHSRIALTNGTWLLVFRKWVDEMTEDKNPEIVHVKHNLMASSHRFIGNNPPAHYNSDRDYSILVWQKYASPVWFDLDGLPPFHDSIWFDIDQTNVLNHKIAREDADSKHICPLQLDLIEKCILKYSQKGDKVLSSFSGVGSEPVTAIKLGRKALGSELKRSYYELSLVHLREAVQEIRTPRLL